MFFQGLYFECHAEELITFHQCVMLCLAAELKHWSAAQLAVYSRLQLIESEARNVMQMQIPTAVWLYQKISHIIGLHSCILQHVKIARVYIKLLIVC